MPKHTPGPWVASKDAVPKDYIQTTIYAETTGQRVATVFQSEDNVHLIAAAPKLLEACKQLVRRVQELENPLNVVSGEQLRGLEAIAEAEGQ